jgi:MoxR-like ATPase
MNDKIVDLIYNIEKVIIGKRESVMKIIAALLCSGHVLIEDVPGVGKTRLAAALSKSVNGKFNRIQLTPDVMPQDITGFTMINPATREFEFKEGAAVCNFLLADEINRASPKVQSGLLEIMDERQISLDGKTYFLPRPFMTLATQNPVETYGTYHLPEAQMDRFLIRLTLGYLQPEEEVLLLDAYYHENKDINPVLTTEQIVALQEEAKNIFCHGLVRDYIMRIVNATRNNENIKLGISPRGTMGLNAMAKATALIKGRDFATPDDAAENAVCVLAHRLILSPKGKGLYKSQEAAILDILQSTPPPQPGTGFAASGLDG